MLNAIQLLKKEAFPQFLTLYKIIKIMSSNITQLISQFLEHLEIERNRSQKTVENYRHYLKRFISWAKIERPENITLELVRKYRLFLNRWRDIDGKSLKKITQNYHIIGLRSFLKYLAKRDIKSLAAEKIELAKTGSRQVEVLDSDELERLLSAPQGESFRVLRDRAILELLFSTGLRVSELTNLNRDSVNLKKGEFSVRGKGDKVRVVFLSERAKRALESWLKKRIDIDEALFIQIKNRKYEKEVDKKASSLRLTPRSIQRIVKYYATKAGLAKKVTPHSIRHSFATDLLVNGADIRSVQAMLGHASITTTQVYTHITNEQLYKVHKAFHGKKKK